MSYEPGAVGEVFDKPNGPVDLEENGRWWINRADLPLDADGNVTIVVGDGNHVTKITGNPKTLRRLADAIVAQVDGAEANTPPADYITFLGYTKTIAGTVRCDACNIVYEHADGALMRGHRRRCPVAEATGLPESAIMRIAE